MPSVQANVPDSLRGRVMSFYVTVFAGSAPLGGLFAGAVAQAFGTPAAFLAGAALSLVTLGHRRARAAAGEPARRPGRHDPRRHPGGLARDRPRPRRASASTAR